MLENFRKNYQYISVLFKVAQKAKILRVDLYGFMRASAALLAVNLQLRVRLFRPKLFEDKGTHLLRPNHFSVGFSVFEPQT
jgi:hypothetical protein